MESQQTSSTATATLCLRKTEYGVPDCFRITMKHGSPLVVTKFVADKPTILEEMQYKIEGDDQVLRKRLIRHIVDNYANTDPENVWEVIDLDS